MSLPDKINYMKDKWVFFFGGWNILMVRSTDINLKIPDGKEYKRSYTCMI